MPRSRQVQLHHSLLPRREVPQQTLDYSHEVQVRLHRGPYDQNDGPQDPSQVKDWLAMPKTAQEFDTYRLEQRLRGEGLRNNAQGNLVLALRSQDPRLDLVGLDPSLHLTVARCWTGERPLPGWSTCSLHTWMRTLLKGGKNWWTVHPDRGVAV